MGVTFEEYRYDALGRRIWVRSRKSCYGHAVRTMCNLSLVRRTVWDGDRELYEIQMPGWEDTPASTMEGDLAAPKEDRYHPYYEEDRNPFFGRVAYTYGHGIDRPLSVVRMGYSDFAMEPHESTWRPHLAPFAILPLLDAHGNIDGGVVSVGGVVNGGRTRCEMWQSKLHCIKIDWPESFFAYERPRYQRWHWHGTLLEDKRNETGTYYRRNRTYDPSSGRFTQEDPIGLAGGLNVYGFAAGDPVSLSDPYGLAPQDCPPCPAEGPVGAAQERFREGTERWFNALVEGTLSAIGGFAELLPTTGVVQMATGRNLDGERLSPSGWALAALGSVPSGGQGAVGARIAGGHAFANHIGEFRGLGIRSRRQFARHVQNVIDGADGADVRSLSRGRRAFWDNASGTVVIFDPGSADFGTAFRPRNGRAYFNNLR